MKYSLETENFFERVYQVVRQIPYGRVTSYGAIANYLGAARSSRMVGWAMNAAHTQPDIPAHRVVNRNGVLTGKMHFGSSIAMEQMLAEEDIAVDNDKIVDFKLHFWDPSTALSKA
ncbi:MAG: MGMT family protein [Dokdonia sp.]|jgi:methylated-DNA-protein-cysteine methyltransferase-like protein